MTKSLLLLLFSAGRLFRQQKVGHGNETKCFGIRNNSLIQTKHIFRFPRPKEKKIFLDSSTQTKKIFFRFLDPNKKKLFWIPRSKQKKNIFRFLNPNKKIFLDSSTMTKSLLSFSAGRLFHCFQLVDCLISRK